MPDDLLPLLRQASVEHVTPSDGRGAWTYVSATVLQLMSQADHGDAIADVELKVVVNLLDYGHQNASSILRFLRMPTSDLVHQMVVDRPTPPDDEYAIHRWLHWDVIQQALKECWATKQRSTADEIEELTQETEGSTDG